MLIAAAAAFSGIELHPHGRAFVFFFLVLLAFFFASTAVTGLSALPLPVNKFRLLDNKNSVLQKKQ